MKEKAPQYLPNTIMLYQEEGKFIYDILLELKKHPNRPYLVYNKEGTTIQLASVEYHPRDWWKYETPLPCFNDADRSTEKIYF